MRKMSILAAVTMVIGLTACERDNNPEQNLIPKVLDLKVGTEEIISNSNDFGIELFTKSVLVEDDNLMLSPLSAGTALTMLLNGCGGETYEQLKGTLNYPAGMSIAEINEAYQNLTSQLLTADPKVTMSLANAIFYRNGFSVKSPFLSVMSTDFNAQVKGLDF
jgi:serpin B